MSDQIIYKVLRPEEWRDFSACDLYAGSPDDVRDGFIHFSTEGQVRETVAKYFANVEGLKLLAYRTADLGNDLKWEESRGDELFPHLYAQLPRAAVKKEWDLGFADDGHQFPSALKGADE